MLTLEHIRISYEYFYRRIYNSNSYNFTYSTQSQQVSEKFLSNLKKKKVTDSFRENSLWRYLLFQFSYWDNLQIESFNNKINFSFIFGQKALDRYYTRDVEYDWQLEDSKLLTKYKLTKNGLVALLSLDKNLLSKFQDPIKTINLNKSSGLNTCIEHTTLFDDKDQSCLACNFKLTCKELLKTNYPNIYKNRGYNGRKEINN